MFDQSLPDRPAYLPRFVRKSTRPPRPKTKSPRTAVDDVSHSEDLLPSGGAASSAKTVSPMEAIIVDLDTPHESAASFEISFAASPAHRSEDPSWDRNLSARPASPAEPGPHPAGVSSSGCVDYPGSSSSPSSPSVTNDVVTMGRGFEDGDASASLRSPTPPWEQPEMDRVHQGPSCSSFPLHSSGATPAEALRAASPQEPATSPPVLEELDVREGLGDGEEHVSEQVTFSAEKIGTLHRFFGRVMPTPEIGFGTTAFELARQLHELLEDHVSSVVRDRFARHGFDPDRP